MDLVTQVLNLQAGAHLCLLYDQDPAEQMAALIPFIRQGLANHEQFIYIADDQSVEVLAEHLRREGIDVAKETQGNRLKLWTRKEWRQPGELSSESKAAQVRGFVADAARAGFKGIRFAVEMTWTLGPDISAARLGHWEATINTLFTPDFPGRIICQYNRARLAPEVLLAALHTHPVAILGPEVCPNPFYEAPLILEGHRTEPEGEGESSQFARRRLDWMVSQLRSARSLEREREELQRQQAAAVEAERLKQLLSLIPAGVYACDAQGHISFYNKRAAELWGREPKLHDPREKFCACSKVFLPDGTYVPPEQTPMALALREGKTFRDLEAVVERPDGSRFIASVSIDVLRGPEGQVLGAINVFQDITALKQTTEALRLREQHLRAIIEHTPECVKVVAGDGTLLQMNPAGLALVEAGSSAEVAGKCVYDLVAPEHRQMYQAMNEQVCAGATADLKFQIVGLRGTRRWMETHATPILDPATGQRVQLALTRDITERQRAEAALGRLAAIVDGSEDAIVSKDLQGTIQSWNKGAERLFGYSAQEMVGQSVLKLIPEELAQEETRILQHIQQGRRVESYETVRRRKDGSLVEVSLMVSPIRDANGRVVGASKIARDITDRKRAEVALRQSERLFRELADFVPQIVWAARPDGYVDYYNRRWYEYTGFPEGECGEASWKPILHPEDAPRCVETYFRCIREQRPYQIEYRFKDRAAGGYRWFLGRAEPIRDEAGRVIRWFGTCTDIDEHKRTAEQLEQAVAERTASLQEAVAQMEEFSYTISHDLRAPLRSMRGFAQALLEDCGPSLPAEAADYLQRIDTSANRMDRMLLDVLTFSRVARTDLRLEAVNLERLVRQIVEQYPGMQLPQACIEIGPLPEVLAHEPSLVQAVSNLLNNAVKFVSPGVVPQVRIFAEPGQATVRLCIQDNGIGIEPKYHHRLFSMFERIHPKMSYDGTGVGLAIVRKAAQRMGGQVGVRSDGRNGSLFWLELPAAPSHS